VTLFGQDPARLWDAETGVQVATLQVPMHQHEKAVVFSPDNRRVIVVGSKESVLSDARRGDKISTLTDRVDGAYFSPDSRRAVAMRSTDLKVYDAADGALLVTLYWPVPQLWGSTNPFEIWLPPIGTIHFSADSQAFVCRWKEQIFVWRRNHPEPWWGVAWLPEFWLTLLFAGALGWSVANDRRRFRTLASR